MQWESYFLSGLLLFNLQINTGFHPNRCNKTYCISVNAQMYGKLCVGGNHSSSLLQGLKSLGEACPWPLHRDIISVLKSFCESSEFFFFRQETKGDVHRKQEKVRGKREGIQLSHFFSRITFLRTLFLEILHCLCEGVCCVSGCHVDTLPLSLPPV